MKQFTAKANNAVSRIWAAIFQAYGGWIYDDSNQSDLPQAYTNIVAGQRRYALPSYALSIQRVEVTDAGGLVRRIDPLPLERVAVGLAEFLNSNGPPQYYRAADGELEIFPASAVNVTDGMELFFDRDSVAFVSTDTTKTPGFASPFHYLVGVGASMEYLKAKQPKGGTLAELKEDWRTGLLELVAYYNKRWRDLRPQMTTPEVDWS